MLNSATSEPANQERRTSTRRSSFTPVPAWKVSTVGYADCSWDTRLVHRIKRHSRCTNARSRERRTSTRRSSFTPVPAWKVSTVGYADCSWDTRLVHRTKRHSQCTNARSRERRTSTRRSSGYRRCVTKIEHRSATRHTRSEDRRRSIRGEQRF